MNLKNLFSFFVLLALVALSLSSCSGSGMEGRLKATAEEVNKQVPMMVDEITRLDNAMAVGDYALQYNYTLVQTDITELSAEDLATFEANMLVRLTDIVKNNPDLQEFRDNDITLIYNYADINGAHITKFEITPELYKK